MARPLFEAQSNVYAKPPLQDCISTVRKRHGLPAVLLARDDMWDKQTFAVERPT